MRWFSEQEVVHSYVVYETDPGASHWSQRCMRQADRVVVLGHARARARAG